MLENLWFVMSSRILSALSNYLDTKQLITIVKVSDKRDSSTTALLSNLSVFLSSLLILIIYLCSLSSLIVKSLLNLVIWL